MNFVWTEEEDAKILSALKEKGDYNREDFLRLMGELPGRNGTGIYKRLRSYAKKKGLLFSTTGVMDIAFLNQNERRKEMRRLKRRLFEKYKAIATTTAKEVVALPVLGHGLSDLQRGVFGAMAAAATEYMKAQSIVVFEEKYRRENAELRKETDELRNENVELKELLRETKGIREAVERNFRRIFYGGHKKGGYNMLWGKDKAKTIKEDIFKEEPLNKRLDFIRFCERHGIDRGEGGSTWTDFTNAQCRAINDLEKQLLSMSGVLTETFNEMTAKTKDCLSSCVSLNAKRFDTATVEEKK
ncbi:MAG TPA: hypothetical protein ACFYD4_08425 [Candidatus Wunengus sp. YC61]|uniref:hypothetical protein n=1 Tax=Candidatus Wunengus sp. YC61 TaxID=3367698 RepID=UPI0040254515